MGVEERDMAHDIAGVTICAGMCRVSESLVYATATHLQHITHCITLQHTATHCNTLQHTATYCNTLKPTATHCNTMQHTATYCNTLHTASLQHTATPYTLRQKVLCMLLHGIVSIFSHPTLLRVAWRVLTEGVGGPHGNHSCQKLHTYIFIHILTPTDAMQ